MFEDLFDFNNKQNEFKKSLKLIFENRLINKEEFNIINTKINELEKTKGYFITKPFRTCDSLGIELHNFMRSLKNKAHKIMEDIEK